VGVGREGGREGGRGVGVEGRGSGAAAGHAVSWKRTLFGESTDISFAKMLFFRIC